MKKGRWKKTLAFALTSVMMVSVAACGKNEKAASDKKDKEDKKNMTYAEVDVSLDDVQGNLGTYTVQGDRIYFYTNEWVEEGTEETAEESGDEVTEDTAGESGDEVTEDTAGESGDEVTEDGSEESEEVTEDGSEGSEEVTEDTSEEEGTDDEEDSDEEYDVGKTNYYLYSVKLDGTDLKECGFLQMDDNSYISDMLVSNEGEVRLLITSYDMTSEKQSYYIAVYDENGNEVEKNEITDVIGSNDEYISRVMMDTEGRYVIAMEKKIITLDANFKKIGEVKTNNDYIESIAKTKDGNVIVGDSTGEGKAKVTVLDVEKQKWGKSYDMDFSYFSSSDSLINGVEYDFYYRDDNGIYGYDMESEKATKLIDFVASNIDTSNAYGIQPVGKDTMVGSTWDTDRSKMVFYKKVDPSNITDKETITVGAMYIDESVKKAAIEFNKENSKYQIDLIDYSNEENPRTKMNADIAAGNVPDIISLSGLPVEQYIEKGILEDLTPYYDKDEDVSADDMVPSVAKAMQTDGKYYYVAPSFYVSTLVAATKDVGEEPGWTVDDMKKLLEERSDATPFYYNNKSELLYSLFASNFGDYVDWSTGECSFDSKDFKTILEICNNGSDEETEWNEGDPSEPTLVREGKVLFTNGGAMEMEQVELFQEMFNGDITFIGYPNEEKNGSYFSFDLQLGIYSKSKMKDAAWEFLKGFMTLEYQGQQDVVYANPTRQDAFDMMVKRKTTTKTYTDELGNEVEPLATGWGWDDFNVDIGPLTDEQAQLYLDLVNSTTKTQSYDDEIIEIVSEEAELYFSGKKGLDETADIIQNRVKTYVNENR